MSAEGGRILHFAIGIEPVRAPAQAVVRVLVAPVGHRNLPRAQGRDDLLGFVHRLQWVVSAMDHHQEVLIPYTAVPSEMCPRDSMHAGQRALSNEAARPLVKILTVDDTSDYHMTTS
jgi:hypothetical protein